MEGVGVLGELLAQLVVLLLPALLLLQLQLPLLAPKGRRGRVTGACPSGRTTLGMDHRPYNFSFWTLNVTTNHRFVGQGDPDVDVTRRRSLGDAGELRTLRSLAAHDGPPKNSGKRRGEVTD